MRKLFLTVLAVSVLVATGAYAALLYQPKVVFRKGPDTWVKIARGNAKLAPFEHPREVKAGDLSRALRSLTYFQPSTYALGGKKGEVLPLFEDADMAVMAEPLAKALGQAGTGEWVDFCFTVFRGPQLFGSFRQTDGVMFWKDGKLNVAFRNLSVKTEPGQTLNTYDPTKGYRAYARLSEGPGQTIKGENWAVIDPAAVPEPAPAVAPGAPAPPGQPAATPPPKSTKDRLLELEQLKKDGLITEEEYEQKRKQILDGI